MRGQSGWLACSRLTMNALEVEDLLVLAGVKDSGAVVDEAQCRRLFDLQATQSPSGEMPASVAVDLEEAQGRRRQGLLEEMASRNGRWFDTEMDKLDHWAEDRRASLKADLADLDEALKEAKKLARFAPTLPDKLERQRAVRVLEGKRDEAWHAYDQASREIDRQKDNLLDEIGQRLEQSVEHEPLFALRWELS